MCISFLNFFCLFCLPRTLNVKKHWCFFLVWGLITMVFRWMSWTFVCTQSWDWSQKQKHLDRLLQAVDKFEINSEANGAKRNDWKPNIWAVRSLVFRINSIPIRFSIKILIESYVTHQVIGHALHVDSRQSFTDDRYTKRTLVLGRKCWAWTHI